MAQFLPSTLCLRQASLVISAMLTHDLWCDSPVSASHLALVSGFDLSSGNQPQVFRFEVWQVLYPLSQPSPRPNKVEFVLQFMSSLKTLSSQAGN